MYIDFQCFDLLDCWLTHKSTGSIDEHSLRADDAGRSLRSYVIGMNLPERGTPAIFRKIQVHEMRGGSGPLPSQRKPAHIVTRVGEQLRVGGCLRLDRVDDAGESETTQLGSELARIAADVEHLADAEPLQMVGKDAL